MFLQLNILSLFSKILQGVLVGIMEYTKLGDDPLNIGEARFVGENFYRQSKTFLDRVRLL